MGGKWYYSYPDLRECHDPAMLSVDEVKIDPVTVNNIRLGKSISPRSNWRSMPHFRTVKGPERPI